MACVEIRKLYGGQRGTRVRGFDLVIQNPEIHVILCTSISALDELVHIMYGTALYKSGTFKLNGKDAIGLRKKESLYRKRKPSVRNEQEKRDTIYNYGYIPVSWIYGNG